MQSAVLQGLYSISTPAVFTCPGVCRWTGSYKSIGFKSQCQNVTEETLQSITCRNDIDSVRTKCNMTTPSGLGISTQSVETDSSTSYFMNATSMLKTPTGGLPDTFPEIARFAIYRSTLDNNYYTRDVNITECSLSLTAYEYTDAKANGSEFSFGKIREIEFGSANPWEHINDDSRWGSLRTNESNANNIPSFGILYTSIAALCNFLESQTIVSEWVEGNYVNENLGLAAALSGDVDLDERFATMATSMTDYLRSRQEAETARGEIIKSQSFVSIRWIYFIPPIMTELVAMLFAVLTIFSNRKSRHVPLWKSSILAVLACQYQMQHGIIYSAVKDIKKFRRSTKNSKVQLQ
jgi:hypothetical protein